MKDKTGLTFGQNVFLVLLLTIDIELFSLGHRLARQCPDNPV